MRIRNNIMAANSSRNRGISAGKMTKSMEKLSSGYRINRAGDDSAGLTLSEQMRRQIHGLNQAMKNVDDGIGMTNTGEATLAEVQSMLQRLKTLATESANGTYNTTSRAAIDQERAELLDEIDRVASSASFNHVPLFDDSTNPPKPAPQSQSDITLQIGATDRETMDVARYYLGSEALGLDGLDFTDQTKANQGMELVEDAITAVSSMRSMFGSATVHMEHTYNSLGVNSENMTAFESHIRDTDIADEMTVFTSANIVTQSAQAMLTQANSLPQSILSLFQGQ